MRRLWYYKDSLRVKNLAHGFLNNMAILNGRFQTLCLRRIGISYSLTHTTFSSNGWRLPDGEGTAIWPI